MQLAASMIAYRPIVKRQRYGITDATAGASDVHHIHQGDEHIIIANDGLLQLGQLPEPALSAP